MIDASPQRPDAHAASPPGASEQPWLLGTEPLALHTSWPVKSRRS